MRPRDDPTITSPGHMTRTSPKLRGFAYDRSERRELATARERPLR
jgi:hypothetical protein